MEPHMPTSPSYTRLRLIGPTRVCDLSTTLAANKQSTVIAKSRPDRMASYYTNHSTMSPVGTLWFKDVLAMA